MTTPFNIFSSIDLKKQAVCWLDGKEVWLSFEKGVSKKISWDEFQKSHIWHNTTLIANTDGSIEAQTPSLSRTTVGGASITDTDIHSNALPFHPKQIIGCMGLIGLASATHVVNNDEFFLITLQQKMILMHFDQNTLVNINTLTLPKKINAEEALSLMIPKLLQFGIRLGDSHCQLLQIENQHAWTEQLLEALAIGQPHHHIIHHLGPWLIDTWWSHKTLITPSKKNLPLPIIHNYWILGLAGVWLMLWMGQPTEPTAMAVTSPKKSVDPNIIGQLTPQSAESNAGPEPLLKALQDIPHTSRIASLTWKYDKIHLSGHSLHSADPHKIQKILHHEFNIPFSELPLTFTKARNRKAMPKWTIGEDS